MRKVIFYIYFNYRHSFSNVQYSKHGCFLIQIFFLKHDSNISFAYLHFNLCYIGLTRSNFRATASLFYKQLTFHTSQIQRGKYKQIRQQSSVSSTRLPYSSLPGPKINNPIILYISQYKF